TLSMNATERRRCWIVYVAVQRGCIARRSQTCKKTKAPRAIAAPWFIGCAEFLLQRFAALSGAADHVPGLGPALALARILSLAGRRRRLARARALARIDAAALHTGV